VIPLDLLIINHLSLVRIHCVQAQKKTGNYWADNLDRRIGNDWRQFYIPIHIRLIHHNVIGEDTKVYCNIIHSII
jgi:hypothetical protein